MTVASNLDDGARAAASAHRPSRTLALGRRSAAWGVLAAAVLSFGVGVGSLRSASISDYGLLATASPAYPLSILLVVFGFAMAIRRNDLYAAAAAIGLMIATQRLPVLVATDAPLYSWTYKHLGVVDYIQQQHELARGVDIYNGWPGLFAFTAWLSDLSGVDPLTMAHWFTPLFHCAFVGLAYGVARAWDCSPPVAMTAAFLVATVNWVAQDYYSPQAIGMLLTAGILLWAGLSRSRPVAVPLVVLLFAALTISHQLTPFWLMLALGLLVVLRSLRPWWILFPLAAILLGYLAYNFAAVDNFTLFSLDLSRNMKSNMPTVGSPGQHFASLCIRVLALSFWGLTVVCLIRRWRRHEPFAALAVVSLSPFLILGGQSYGGEAVFRVFLYSLLGCSIVLAGPLHRMLTSGWAKFCATTTAMLLAAALSAQAFFGAWFSQVTPAGQVDAAATLLETLDYPSYFTTAVSVWPQRSTGRYADYARFHEHYDDPILPQLIPGLLGSHFDNDKDYHEFTEAIESRFDAPTYLVITPQMSLDAWYYGLLPLDALPNLERRLAADPNWENISTPGGYTLYRHAAGS